MPNLKCSDYGKYYDAFSNSSNITSNEVLSWNIAPLEILLAGEKMVSDCLSQSTYVLNSKNFSGEILKTIKDFFFGFGMKLLVWFPTH